MADIADYTPNVAVITGAAQGIGRTIALRLAEDGFDIALGDLPSQQAKLGTVIEEITAKGRKAIIVHTDVTKESDVEQLIEQTVQRLGGVDVMIANAGIVKHIPLVELTTEIFDLHMNVNARGVMLCYKHAVLQMLKQKRGGRIIGASSVLGRQATAPLHFAYSASKFAVRGMTQALALEMLGKKITVNAYAPGFIITDMTMNEQDVNYGTGAPGSYFKHICEIPQYAPDAGPEVVASYVSYLCKPEAHFVNVTILSAIIFLVCFKKRRSAELESEVMGVGISGIPAVLKGEGKLVEYLPSYMDTPFRYPAVLYSTPIQAVAGDSHALRYSIFTSAFLPYYLRPSTALIICPPMLVTLYMRQFSDFIEHASLSVEFHQHRAFHLGMIQRFLRVYTPLFTSVVNIMPCPSLALARRPPMHIVVYARLQAPRARCENQYHRFRALHPGVLQLHLPSIYVPLPASVVVTMTRSSMALILRPSMHVVVYARLRVPSRDTQYHQFRALHSGIIQLRLYSVSVPISPSVSFTVSRPSVALVLRPPMPIVLYSCLKFSFASTSQPQTVAPQLFSLHINLPQRSLQDVFASLPSSPLYIPMDTQSIQVYHRRMTHQSFCPLVLIRMVRGLIYIACLQYSRFNAVSFELIQQRAQASMLIYLFVGLQFILPTVPGASSQQRPTSSLCDTPSTSTLPSRFSVTDATCGRSNTRLPAMGYSCWSRTVFELGLRIVAAHEYADVLLSLGPGEAVGIRAVEANTREDREETSPSEEETHSWTVSVVVVRELDVRDFSQFINDMLEQNMLTNLLQYIPWCYGHPSGPIIEVDYPVSTEALIQAWADIPIEVMPSEVTRQPIGLIEYPFEATEGNAEDETAEVDEETSGSDADELQVSSLEEEHDDKAIVFFVARIRTLKSVSRFSGPFG
ncbi:hypothetical protein EUX98_g6587 [Antrodiella citrinella]|uniref:Uncharacterized protein n=1 Tax=Antrodiella citrinella TaxID=2447956 RepID=A0A4S4MR62_9APHY|nr:hypothetical protein EUX98_g6587 [Antrodiella citrinella]